MDWGNSPMAFFKDRYSKPGPGIEKDEPKKTGVALFFSILGREFFSLFKLNLLFLLFSIPIVTIPAALTAMSKITLHMVRDENYFMWSEFWETWKKEFLKSLGAGALLVVLIGLSIISIQFYTLNTSQNMLVYVPLALSWLLCFLGIVAGFYIFPMIALMNFPLKTSIKNSFLLVMVRLPYNLLVLAIIIVVGFLMVAFFPLTVPLLFVALFAILNLIAVFCAYSGMEKYVISSDAQMENPSVEKLDERHSNERENR